MKKAPITDYDKIHEVFDGIMPACLGKDCVAACCHEKIAITHDAKKVPFFTTLHEGEQEWLKKQCPDMESRGITIQTADIGYDRPQSATFVNGCLDPVLGCKLKDAKPVVCMLFPFIGSSLMAVDTRCDNLNRIIIHQETIEKVKNVLGLLGVDIAMWEKDFMRVRAEILEALSFKTPRGQEQQIGESV